MRHLELPFQTTLLVLAVLLLETPLLGQTIMGDTQICDGYALYETSFPDKIYHDGKDKYMKSYTLIATPLSYDGSPVSVEQLAERKSDGKTYADYQVKSTKPGSSGIFELKLTVYYTKDNGKDGVDQITKKTIIVNNPSNLLNVMITSGVTALYCNDATFTATLSDPSNYGLYYSDFAIDWSLTPENSLISIEKTNAYDSQVVVTNNGAPAGNYSLTVTTRLTGLNTKDNDCPTNMSDQKTQTFSIKYEIPSTPTITRNPAEDVCVGVDLHTMNFVCTTLKQVTGSIGYYEWIVEQNGKYHSTKITTDNRVDLIYGYVPEEYQLKVRGVNPCGIGSYSSSFCRIEDPYCYPADDGGPVEPLSNLPVSPEVQEAEGESFQLYPNPASEVLQVRFSDSATDGSIELVDETGRMVKVTTLQSGQADIRVSDLNAGIYWVRYSGNQGQLYKRMVIQH